MGARKKRCMYYGLWNLQIHKWHVFSLKLNYLICRSHLTYLTVGVRLNQELEDPEIGEKYFKPNVIITVCTMSFHLRQIVELCLNTTNHEN